MTLLSALTTLCLILLATAQTFKFVPNVEGIDTADDRVSGYALGANCDCTGSGAAVVPEVKKMLADGVAYINSIESERSLGTSYQVLNNCTKMYGHDTCMNAEASLRVTPTTTTLCIYDKTTGANLAEDDTGLLRPVVKCRPAKVSSATTATPTPSSHASTNPSPISKPSSLKSVLVSPTPTSKSQTTAPAKEDTTKKRVTEPAKPPAPIPSKAPTKPSTPETPPSPLPTQKADPTKTPPPGSTDPSSGGVSTDAAATSPAAASPTPASGGNTPELGGSEISNVLETIAPTPTPVLNEGCIAVEHLRGVELQHRAHLWREVLCARGICATKHHALLVDGAYTCMGEVCKRERCVRTMKFVNNLNVWKNRRVAIADGVVATPYDVRFPKCAVWLVQAAELALEAARDAGALVSAGVVTAVIVLARARKSRGGAV